MKTFHSLIFLIGKQKTIFIFAILTLLLGVTFEASGRLVIRDIVDTVLADKINLTNMQNLILLFTFCTLMQGTFHFISARWKTSATESIVRSIRNKLFNHIQQLSFHYHDHTPVGELVQRATSDVDSVRRFYGDQIPGILQIIFRCLIFFGAIALIDIRIALVTSIIIPVLTSISTFFFHKIYQAYDLLQTCEGEVSSSVQENLNGIRVVRAFAQQNYENRMFETKNRAQLNAGLKEVFWHSSYWPVAHILCGTQLCVSILYTGYTVINGENTVGTLVAASFLFNGLIWPLQDLGRLITEISHSFVSFNRIEEIMTEETEDTENNISRDNKLIQSDNKPLSGRYNNHSESANDSNNFKLPLRLEGHIEFENLCFSYGDTAPVLKNISFECKPGQKIALVGETGSGKTSIVNLLPRFYPYQSGNLLIDRIPVTDYPRNYLRKNIGIVEQNPFLFTTTIRENIEYGTDRDIDFEEVVKAAKAAAIHNDIMRFPLKYDTVVGEKGISLSGGQKQRIVIARTILKDPHILILDDSTSAVDADTEQCIRKAINNLLKGRSTFIIAHRIQTLKEADMIIVLKEGEIKQQGSHDELIKVPGFYKDIFEIQTRIEKELILEIESNRKGK